MRSCRSGTGSGSSRGRPGPRCSSRSPARITTTSCGLRAPATPRPCAISRFCFMAAEPLLFTYGTLMRGFRLHALLEGRADFVGDGEVAGLLFDLGRYPAALRDGGGVIRGEV